MKHSVGPLHKPVCRRVQRARRLGRRRGVTVFVVVLVLAMLTGLGLFAARSASLATTTSGYERQMAQTHYFTEYALLAATAELSTGRRNAYVSKVRDGQYEDCPPLPAGSQCYVFGPKDLERTLPTTAKYLVAYNAGSKTPSSLGQADIDAIFRVDMSDFQQASQVAGMDQTGRTVNLQNVLVVLSATGQVRPRPSDPNVLENRHAAIAITETTRAHVIVGPVEKPDGT